MSTPPEPLSVKITPVDGKSYKSISAVQWDDIPGFSILTGRNGSGKTQLLEILAHHFTGSSLNYPANGSSSPVQITVLGSTIEPSEIAYVPSSGRFSGGAGVSLGNMAHARQQFAQSIQNLNNQGIDVTTRAKAFKAYKVLSGKSYNLNQPDTLKDILPDSMEYMLDDVDVTAGLAYVFMAYRLKSVQAMERGTPGLNKDGTPLEPAPWDVVNESLNAAGFAYRVISPVETDLIDLYTLRLRDVTSSAEVGSMDLSSGEKVLLQATLWLYSSSKPGIFPKLLLLDEPDAHLHPSMTIQFLTVLSNVLVDKYGVRIIMTSHSPSTVALAPEGSVFEMKRHTPEISKVQNRQDIISVLTAGILTVSKATKFCFVEDNDDVDFYDSIRDILTDFGPSKDPCSLSPSPSIVFLPVSVGKGPSGVSGGCTIIEKWVAKLDTTPLDKMFIGTIDRDESNTAKPRIFVLSRYSFENYLVDPLNLFTLLVEEGTAPAVAGLSISAGDEHRLRTLDTPLLQSISDEITLRMEGSEPSLKTADRLSVQYTSGHSVLVPSWVVNKKGKDLLAIAQKAFGDPRTISPPRLLKAVRRGRLIPKDLATLLANIQAF